MDAWTIRLTIGVTILFLLLKMYHVWHFWILDTMFSSSASSTHRRVAVIQHTGMSLEWIFNSTLVRTSCCSCQWGKFEWMCSGDWSYMWPSRTFGYTRYITPSFVCCPRFHRYVLPSLFVWCSFRRFQGRACFLLGVRHFLVYAWNDWLFWTNNPLQARWQRTTHLVSTAGYIRWTGVGSCRRLCLWWCTWES